MINTQTRHFSPLYIQSAGACCPVGMSLAAADCALRANLDNFKSGNFFDKLHEPLRVAQLPDENVRGNSRLANFCAIAIDECIQQLKTQNNEALNWDETPLLLLAAERSRPHTDDNRYQKIFALIQEKIGCKFHPMSRIIPAGRAGIGLALQQAQVLLLQKDSRQVLIAGVDSFLDSHTISHFLQQARLRSSDNSDGFIPGEAASAILVSHHQTDSHQLAITGLGIAEESASQTNTPSKAIGLSTALNQALDTAHINSIDSYTKRFTDQNGESLFTREAAHAFTRVGLRGLQKLDTLTIADTTGEIGAAMGPLMLAWATKRLQQPHNALAHLANDDGLRVAIALTAGSKQPQGEHTI
jgi:3-oxoacyl-[acyl-carrier-protein] synthase I